MAAPMKLVVQQPTTTTQESGLKRKFRPVKRLTLPLFSMAHLKILTCEVLEGFYEAEISTGLGKEATAKPYVCKVCNLDTDEQGLLIANAIIRSAFEGVEGGYVGKVFQLRSGEIRDGKKYRDIDIVLMQEDNS